MARFFALALLVTISGFLSGCATTSESNDPNHVTNIPWNKPERWESQGPMGGMLNTH